MQKIGKPRHKYLVFTCAGDRSNIRTWLEGNRNFDLWVTYYGDEEGRYSEVADFYNARKGKKFPNLHHVYRNWFDILDHYEAIFVADDDIVINGAEISMLFEFREQHNLWILQPAFDPRGKITHYITRMRPWLFMRYTNFVEVTCPLFRKDKLDQFMEVYDPELVGWGVDWWFLEVLGRDLQGHVAIIDAISCINPHDRDKGRQKETDEPQYARYRRENQGIIWKQVRSRYNIRSEKRGFKTYGSVNSWTRVENRVLMFLRLAILSCIRRLQKVGLSRKKLRE